MKNIFLALALFLASCSQKQENTNLIWSDEFDNSESLSQNWNIIEGNGCPQLCGFGNNELQYYTSNEENLKVENGHLIITATKDKNDIPYYSAKLTSEDKSDWQYAYIEVKAKLPQGRGTWPAIWMLPSQKEPLEWPLDGEIDIMEHVGYNQGTIYGTIHTQAYNHIKGTQKSDSLYLNDAADNFHVYAVDWQKDYISWYVDDKLYHTIERNNDGVEAWPFTKEFHLILNLAVGGNWGGREGVDETIFPQSMMVDYVRVFKKRMDNQE